MAGGEGKLFPGLFSGPVPFPEIGEQLLPQSFPVFIIPSGLTIREWDGEKAGKERYSLAYTGWKKVRYEAAKQGNRMLDWALGYVKYRMR